ncbi:hypothetical protein DACRYDRAFT_117584 [Dacryopinax primogenitus]|uniref:Uncharacterized protein n=1 Tax=Dacryopinax primogenitus (strain DJM 731) TaxID=1858805 RepID=M5G260_DACPD|nr:uncharacterized protein DACRYDRAFT_117584 [Dacryopinax primogenitus]EJT99966.1 hypothetical protein DACRYDRAFT_117584 [Dacryopinax primogenitus]
MAPQNSTKKKLKTRSKAPRSVQLLEVEDDDARESRLGNLLEQKASEHLRSSSATKARSDSWNTQRELPLRLGRLNEPLPTMETTSNLISRLDAFLPSLKASNDALIDQAARDPNSIDIEHLTPTEEGMVPAHIEMNLGLGVFTVKRGGDASTAEDSNGEDNGEDDSDGEDGDEGTESDATSEVQSESSDGHGGSGEGANNSGAQLALSDQNEHSTPEMVRDADVAPPDVRYRPPAA